VVILSTVKLEVPSVYTNLNGAEPVKEKLRFVESPTFKESNPLIVTVGEVLLVPGVEDFGGIAGASVLVQAKTNRIPKAKIALFIVKVLYILWGIIKIDIKHVAESVATTPYLT
jgi:hypothetical protein